MHLLTLRQSACAPAPIPFPPTSLNSQPSFDTSMSNSSQSVEFGLTNQQQYSEDGSKSGRHSAIVQARFDPDQVAGINRYKHFHRPLIPISPRLISPQENGPTADIENDGNDDGQSIDKTSPRRRSSKKRLLFPLKNGCRGSVLLPAIVSNNESNDLLRQRAHSTNGLIKQTAGNKNATFYKAKFVVTGRNLEQTLLPPLSFPAWLDGSSISGKHQQQRALDFGLPNSGHRRCVSSSAIAAISSAALGQQPTMAAKIRAHTKETLTTNGRRPREQKMGTGVTNVEHSRKATAEAVDEVTTTVRVRRRIIISSDMKTAIPKKEPSISKNASIDSSSSGQPIKASSNPRRKPLRKGQAGNRKLVTAVESIGTQTECREVVDVVSTDGGGAERQTNTAAVPSGRARATQTEASKLWVAGSHRSSIIGPVVVQLQLLDIIERALDETIDRQSRLRASKKIAISARNQAQIWRDAKEFVLHLLARSIDLAGRTNRKLSCERSVRSLLKINCHDTQHNTSTIK